MSAEQAEPEPETEPAADGLLDREARPSNALPTWMLKIRWPRRGAPAARSRRRRSRRRLRITTGTLNAAPLTPV